MVGLPAVDAEGEAAGGTLAHVCISDEGGVRITRESHFSPVNNGRTLAGESGAGHHVGHGVQLGLQEDPLVPLVEVPGHQLQHLVGEDLSGALVRGTVEVTDRSLSYPDSEVTRHAVLAVNVVTAQELDTLSSHLQGCSQLTRNVRIRTNLVSEANITAVEREAEFLILLHLIEFPQ